MGFSHHYNPDKFDPWNLDYQQDVRLAVRDEMPDEPDASDVSESLYSQMFHTELVYPPIFFGGWAAFEPDVSIGVSPASRGSQLTPLSLARSISSITPGRRVPSRPCSAANTPCAATPRARSAASRASCARRPAPRSPSRLSRSLGLTAPAARPSTTST